MVIVAGSVLVAVGSAGAVLSLLGPAASFALGGLLVQLLLIVGLPLLAGSLLRTLVGERSAPLAMGRLLGVLALLALLWQVSGQIQLTVAYAQATGVLALFLAGSIALGRLLVIGRPRSQKVALALPVGMRDFAIAAGIATTAYGPAAAAPLAPTECSSSSTAPPMSGSPRNRLVHRANRSGPPPRPPTPHRQDSEQMSIPDQADHRDPGPSEAQHVPTVQTDPDPGRTGPEVRPGGRHRWWPGLLALAAVACCALPGLLSAGVLAGLAGVGVAGFAGLGGGLIFADSGDHDRCLRSRAQARRRGTTGACATRVGSCAGAPDDHR